MRQTSCADVNGASLEMMVGIGIDPAVEIMVAVVIVVTAMMMAATTEWSGKVAWPPATVIIAIGLVVSWPVAAVIAVSVVQIGIAGHR